jgi:hypothetical protein
MAKIFIISMVVLLSVSIFVNVLLVSTNEKNKNSKEIGIQTQCIIPSNQIEELHYIPKYEGKGGLYMGIKTVTDSNSGEMKHQLFIADKQMTCNTEKVLWTILGPGEDFFYNPAITIITNKYILVKKSETYKDFMVLNLDGKIISEGIVSNSDLVKSTQSTEGVWEAEEAFQLASDKYGKTQDNTIHVLLHMFGPEKDAIALVDLQTGKIDINTLSELK